MQDELDSQPQKSSDVDGGFIGVHLRRVEEKKQKEAEAAKKEAARAAARTRSDALIEAGEDPDDIESDARVPKPKKGFLERTQEKLELMEKRADAGLVDHAIKDPRYKRQMKQLADIKGAPGIETAPDQEGQEAVYQALME